jgi:hypothetical protein
MPSKTAKGNRHDDREEFLASPRLRARGWPESLIRRFLPEPDERRDNPHYKGGPPMRLYLRERVEEIEQTEEFREARAKAEPRRQAAGRGVMTKKERLEQYLKALIIEVPLLEDNELSRRACEHYNERQRLLEDAGRRFSDLPATPDSDESFLRRIAVNYLRHALTRYEDELARIAGRTSAAEPRLELSKKVYDAIAAAYPWLAGECREQYRTREEAAS